MTDDRRVSREVVAVLKQQLDAIDYDRNAAVDQLHTYADAYQAAHAQYARLRRALFTLCTVADEFTFGGQPGSGWITTQQIRDALDAAEAGR